MLATLAYLCIQYVEFKILECKVIVVACILYFCCTDSG